MKAVYITIGIIAVGAIGYGVYTSMQSKSAIVGPSSQVRIPGIVPTPAVNSVPVNNTMAGEGKDTSTNTNNTVAGSGKGISGPDKADAAIRTAAGEGKIVNKKPTYNPNREVGLHN